MSEDHERVVRDHVERLAAEADIPSVLLDGQTSAEAFEAWTAPDRERARAAREWAADMAETTTRALCDTVIEDERLITGVSQGLADAGDLKHSRRCETEGCRWAVHTGSEDRAQAEYDKHLRTDPRHTGGAWIDRDGRERRGLAFANEGGPTA